MNGRIRELAEQARKYAFEKVENSQDPTEWSTKYYNEMFDEKFAELIVRECIDIISPYAIRMENFDGGHPITEIKKHFGVEE